MPNRGAAPLDLSNGLLKLLPADDLDRMRPFLEPVALRLGQVLLGHGDTVESVFFIQSGTVSMVSTMEDGSRIEVGMVGYEGMVGLPLLLGSTTSPLEGLVQIGGGALRLGAAEFRAALTNVPSLLPLLLRYLDAFLVQVSQSAACNGRHAIEQRLARWLLMEHDRAFSNTFVLTQEFLSILLGVQRPGVTLAMGALQRAGLVRHAKGTLEVVNRSGLEAAACECYGIVRQRFGWLIPQE